MLKNIRINFDENDIVTSIVIEDDKNRIEHFMDEETDKEKITYGKMSLKDFIEEYLDYYERNKEDDENVD